MFRPVCRRAAQVLRKSRFAKESENAHSGSERNEEMLGAIIEG
jgi:hypothetical protein